MDGEGIGAAIRSRRKALGLTQAELAARLGGEVPQFEVSRLERDRFQLNGLRRLARVAEALEWSLGDLLAAGGWHDAVHTVQNGGLDPTPPSPHAVTRPTARVIRARRRSPAVPAGQLIASSRAERMKLREAIRRSREICTVTQGLAQAFEGGPIGSLFVPGVLASASSAEPPRRSDLLGAGAPCGPKPWQWRSACADGQAVVVTQEIPEQVVRVEQPD